MGIKKDLRSVVKSGSQEGLKMSKLGCLYFVFMGLFLLFVMTTGVLKFLALVKYVFG
jgi:hypothetical protein